MTDQNRGLVLGLGCVGIVLADVGLLLTRPSLPVALAALASLAVLLVALVLLLADVRRARRAASAPVPRYPLRALDQEQYAALLRGDADRRERFETMADTRGFACRRCKRIAKPVAIRHPIWDGPFEESGSGSVDVRLLSWCPVCDAPAPSEEGSAVRLPFLDNLPIRLLPELYERTAFRSLPDPVELYVPPPPAPPEPAAHEKTTPP